MSVKLLTEYHLEFLSLKGGYTGTSKFTLVKMQHCWKSHVTAHLVYFCFCILGDKVIIASTDYDWRQAEERTLLECDECSNKQVQLDSKFALADPERGTGGPDPSPEKITKT